MAEMSASTGHRLAAYWKANGHTTIRPPASATALTHFEHRYRVRLPDELRDYFAVADGMGVPHDQDDNGFSFWPLDRIVPVSSYKTGAFAFPGSETCFLFADYLGWSWAYAFRLSSGAAVAPTCIVGTEDGQPKWISVSFTAFVDCYVADCPDLYI